MPCTLQVLCRVRILDGVSHRKRDRFRSLQQGRIWPSHAGRGSTTIAPSR